MKKSLLKSFAVFALAAVVFNGCKNDEDTTPPVITLKGTANDQLEMLQTYVDLGATASDDQDGDLTAAIVITSDINNKLPGNYEVHYEVSDNAGNFTDVHRAVNVYATGNALAKNYSVKDTCGTGASAIPFSYSQSATVVSANSILFNKFADYTGNNAIHAEVAANGVITLTSQSATGIGSLSQNHTFQGSGYVTANGFYLTYTDANTSVTPTQTASCRAYFTRM